MVTQKRNRTLQVRFSEAEWEALQVLSKSAGMTMSAIVRDHLQKIKITNRQDEKNKVIMLNRINSNLNMIARWVNTYRQAAEGVEVVTHLIAVESAIKAIKK
jgi:hypothetical protein